MRSVLKSTLVAALATAGLAGHAAADVKVAVVGPMTGEYAVFGAQMALGAKQAVADINAAGGLLGQTIVLDVEDDACDPAKAETVAKAIAAGDAALVAGHFCSGASVAAAPVYAAAKRVMISPATGTPGFTDERAGPGVFRLYQRDDRQGVVMGSFLADTFADRAIAILDDGSAYSSGFANKTVEAMRAAGKEEALRETYKPGEADYAALVAELKDAGIEVVFAGGYLTEVAKIRREMTAQGLDAVLVAGDAIVSDLFWTLAGEGAAGTLMTFVPDPRRNPAAWPVLVAIEAAGGSGEGFVLYTYAAVKAWADAVAAAGTTDFDPVVAALSSGTSGTPLGDIAFDANGDAKLPGYVIYEWNDGGYAEYEPR
jgi:branched-chain amino acid transport system substrate-binding protein